VDVVVADDYGDGVALREAERGRQPLGIGG